MSLPLTWMADHFRAAGLNVVEVDGWKTRGRPYTFEPRAVVFHHTASSLAGGNAPSLRIVRDGRGDISGPLSQVLVARDGTVYVVAAGRANHAGYGGPWRNIPKDAMNRYGVGVEVENNGIGEPWSEQLLAALDKVYVVLLKGLGLDESWLLGHKEWTPRKIDPAGINMGEYRARIAGVLRGGIPAPTPAPVPAPAPAPAPKPPAPSYPRQGSKGAEVTWIQGRLNAHGIACGVDGDFGPRTHEAVVLFQRRRGLAADGIVGPVTRAALEVAPRPKLAVDGDFGPKTVAALQRALGVADDGVYGPATKKALQRHLGVSVDGDVGPVTIKALQRRVGAHVDGVWGSGTTRALQVALNERRF